jgi:hypothetical protein
LNTDRGAYLTGQEVIITAKTKKLPQVSGNVTNLTILIEVQNPLEEVVFTFQESFNLTGNPPHTTTSSYTLPPDALTGNYVVKATLTKDLVLIDTKEKTFEVTAPPAAPLLSKATRQFRNSLEQNYPNPFNPETWIPYALEKGADVTITIYDVKGRVVKVLSLGHKPAGFYTSRDKAAYWDGKNEVGERVASGIYFYTIQASSFKATRRMVVVR